MCVLMSLYINACRVKRPTLLSSLADPHGLFEIESHLVRLAGQQALVFLLFLPPQL